MDDYELGVPVVTTCPFCDGEIGSTARKCRHCGEWLDGRQSPGQQSVGLAKLVIIAIGVMAVLAVYFSIRSGF